MEQNKEIIIDGVDVSECKYYVTYTKDCINDNKSYNKCESYNDCYYKQLKRLEQENEELKHRNENLRIALKTYEMPEVIKVLTDWRTGELQLQEKRLNKYKHALEEIRDIASQTIIDYTEIVKNNEKLKALDLRNRMSEIQNIINEAGE